jgi:hypothetical protein
MKMVAVCTQHNRRLGGEIGLVRSNDEMTPLQQDLPDLAFDSAPVISEPSRPWELDLSASYCMLDDSSSNACAATWQVHVFGVEGAWLTYWDGKEHPSPDPMPLNPKFD